MSTKVGFKVVSLNGESFNEFISCWVGDVIFENLAQESELTKLDKLKAIVCGFQFSKLIEQMHEANQGHIIKDDEKLSAIANVVTEVIHDNIMDILKTMSPEAMAKIDSRLSA